MLSNKAKRELKIDQRQILIDSIEIGISSPQQICLWGSRQLPNGKKVGLVKNSKTVNYKRFTPFRDGLFCERIFGPVTSLVCACGKKQPHSKVTFCEKCEVEYIDQRSRRYRLGYISLLSPVTHIWYLKGRPSYLSLFLGKRKKTVVALAYCNAYLIEHSHYRKENEVHLWPFMKSLSNTENLLQNNFYKSSSNSSHTRKSIRQGTNTNQSYQFLSPKRLDFALTKPLQIEKTKLNPSIFLNSKKQSFALVKPQTRKQSLELSTFGAPQGNSLCKGKRAINRTKIDKEPKGFCKKNCHALTSYGTYSYVRQQTLPFLPTFVSHFYLRDALLNFIYSSATYSDIPLMEYCRTSRREPLQDVHKLMAHQTVDSFKNDFTYERSLPRSQTSLKKVVRNDDFFSYSNAKIGTDQRLRPYKASQYRFINSRLKSIPWSLPYPLKKVKAGSQSFAFRLNAPLYKYKSRSCKRTSTNLRFVRSFVSTKCLLCFSKVHLPLRFANKSSYKSPYKSKICTCTCKKVHPKICSQKRSFCTGNAFKAGKNNSLFYTNFKFVRTLPSQIKKTQFKKEKQKVNRVTNILRNIQYLLRYNVKSSSLCTFGASGRFGFTRAKALHHTCIAIFAYKFVASSKMLDKLDSVDVDLRQTKKYSLRLLYFWRTNVSQNEKYRKNLVSKKYERDNKNQQILRNNENSVKIKINEENNPALLSHLELTTIREILSYTGGGALQQLLQQFDQHDLCKFLFAEKQILRVLYQKHITHFADLFTSSLGTSRNSSSPLQMEDLMLSPLPYPLKGVKSGEQMFTKINYGEGKAKQPKQYIKSTNHQWMHLLTNQRFIKRFVNVRHEKEGANLMSDQTLMRFVKEGKRSDLQKKQIVRVSRRIYKVARRLKVAQLLTLNHRRPEWMILSHLPVLPPDLRPILQMSEKVIVASDLNIMYQRVIYRNNRHLRVRFIDFHLVTAIQRLVQDAVDRLMENGKGGSKPYYTQGGRPLKSLSDILKGKKGRFRLNLLGKRVDFSGRSVIVVAPSLKIHECGLPKDIALELYHYFLLRQLIVKKQCASIVTAKKMIKSKSSLMWDILRELMYHHPVLLNRAPTLHRLGIQAFQPKLVLGNAIWLHPLVCSGFNADFDGDQMGVHLPLSFAARAESWDLLWSRNNLLSPATGQPMLVPSQDMVLGFYYITAKAISLPKSSSLNESSVLDKLAPYKNSFFLNTKEIITNLQKGQIRLHTPVWLHWNNKLENEKFSQIPLELRVHGFGLQRYIYEKYINSNFFTKTKVIDPHNCKSKYKKEQLQIEDLYSKNFKSRESFSRPNSLQKNFVGVRFFLYSQDKNPLNKKDSTNLSVNEPVKDVFSYLICTEPKAYYIRTTAGRVLMNNILKI